MTLDLVLEDKNHPGILIVTLNYPEKRNALSINLLERLRDVLEKARQDEQLRVLILKGAGAAFCTGLDLNEGIDPKAMHHSAEMISEVMTALYSLPLFTIAAVHGIALAGGAGLMSVCDYSLVAEGTQFGFPEVRRGLVPALVMLFLARQIRQHDLREILLLGERFDAQKALQIGMVNRVVSQENLMEEALKIANTSLLAAPSALGNTKRLFEQLFPPTLSHEMKAATQSHLQARSSDEAQEGIKAFLEKREPIWLHHRGKK